MMVSRSSRGTSSASASLPSRSCTMGAFSMRDARSEYCSVESVSSRKPEAGVTQASMSVRAEPPSESASSFVSLLSR